MAGQSDLSKQCTTMDKKLKELRELRAFARLKMAPDTFGHAMEQAEDGLRVKSDGWTALLQSKEETEDYHKQLHAGHLELARRRVRSRICCSVRRLPLRCSSRLVLGLMKVMWTLMLPRVLPKNLRFLCLRRKQTKRIRYFVTPRGLLLGQLVKACG